MNFVRTLLASLASGDSSAMRTPPTFASGGGWRSIVGNALGDLSRAAYDNRPEYEPGGTAQSSPRGFSFPSGPRVKNGFNDRGWTSSLDDRDDSDAYNYQNAYTTEAPYF